MATGQVVSLETERLILRDFEESDWAAVHDYARRPEVSRFMNWGPNSESDSKDYIGRALAKQTKDPRSEYELAVVERTSRRLVGGCGIDVVSQAHQRGFIGYCLHPDVWGQGYATEASRAVVSFGFEQLGLERIYTTCDADNIASSRVLEKTGMQREGQLRHDMFIRGKWRDSLVYGILREEWVNAE